MFESKFGIVSFCSLVSSLSAKSLLPVRKSCISNGEKLGNESKGKGKVSSAKNFGAYAYKFVPVGVE